MIDKNWVGWSVYFICMLYLSVLAIFTFGLVGLIVSLGCGTINVATISYLANRERVK